jgi:hypothetical protein
VLQNVLLLLLGESSPSSLSNLNSPCNRDVIEFIHIMFVMRNHPWRAFDPSANFLYELFIFLGTALRFLVIAECPPTWQINIP